MKEVRTRNTPLHFNRLTVGTGAYQATLTDIDLPIYILRTGWRQPFPGLGGKAWITGVPFLSSLEAGLHLNFWEYNGSIVYPDTLSPGSTVQQAVADPSDSSLYTFVKTPLTLGRYGYSFYGMQGTPFVKLMINIDARKALLRNLSPFQLFAGGGVFFHFSTPMLSREFAQQAIYERTGGVVDIANVREQFQQKKVEQYIVSKIKQRLTRPAFGFNISTGFTLKAPILPIGLYGDAHYMLPVTAIDPYTYLGGYGFVFDGGLAVMLF